MAKAELKTRENNQSVTGFINQLAEEQRRRDCIEIMEMMKKATGAEPKMWGDNIIGFGNCYLKYASGRELDWFVTGFSPRKQNFSLYIMSGFKHYDDLMKKLGKFKKGSSCLYINKLDDIDRSILRKLIDQSVEYFKKKHNG